MRLFKHRPRLTLAEKSDIRRRAKQISKQVGFPLWECVMFAWLGYYMKEDK